MSTGQTEFLHVELARIAFSPSHAQSERRKHFDKDALAELVELKRIKDAGGPFPPEYERRKLLAWQTAFRVCGVIGEPKA